MPHLLERDPVHSPTGASLVVGIISWRSRRLPTTALTCGEQFVAKSLTSPVKIMNCLFLLMETRKARGSLTKTVLFASAAIATAHVWPVAATAVLYS
eukprot:10796038-Heterocapsa_arctica.AAC.1